MSSAQHVEYREVVITRHEDPRFIGLRIDATTLDGTTLLAAHPVTREPLILTASQYC